MVVERCPFCGSEECELVDSGRWVFCSDCLAEGPCLFSSQKAVDAWNFLSLLRWGQE
jgi:hypothetical protein